MGMIDNFLFPNTEECIYEQGQNVYLNFATDFVTVEASGEVIVLKAGQGFEFKKPFNEIKIISKVAQPVVIVISDGRFYDNVARGLVSTSLTTTNPNVTLALPVLISATNKNKKRVTIKPTAAITIGGNYADVDADFGFTISANQIITIDTAGSIYSKAVSTSAYISIIEEFGGA